MPLSFLDRNAPAPNGVAAPRGLLRVPPEVEQAVAREEAKQRMTPEYRRSLVDRLTLQYYFEDLDIAYRSTPQGVEVLAVGLDEIGALVRNTPSEQRQGVLFGQG
jgi:hypothetical protein